MISLPNLLTVAWLMAAHASLTSASVAAFTAAQQFATLQADLRHAHDISDAPAYAKSARAMHSFKPGESLTAAVLMRVEI